MLIGARFLQGIGGALCSAVILGMIVTMLPEPREQAKAIGAYSFVASAGACLGLLVGGALTEAISWNRDEGISLDKGADVPGAERSRTRPSTRERRHPDGEGRLRPR